ncbi:hypothetical protein GIB67_012613 [Kingdonia uniflora]|uniref:Uncharacterized protein n=1 Tax=Kingdonia uniflora TaxID=39325 RepID=A0A7J7NEU8_9MAGN|nr:hypothetical protein GIB67_012613 [Kingdonia uniflora]
MMLSKLNTEQPVTTIITTPNSLHKTLKPPQTKPKPHNISSSIPHNPNNNPHPSKPKPKDQEHTATTINVNGLQFIRGMKLLSDLSILGIGGPCAYFVQDFSHTHLVSAISYCNKYGLRFIIIRKGSNCLFDDRGFDSCTIFNRIEFVERVGMGAYRVGSGYGFNKFGVEFAGGVPATVGDAVYINAGANGQSDDTEKISKLEFDPNYALRYEHNKNREELHKLQELKKKGIVEDSDDSETESEDDGDTRAMHPQLFDILDRVKKRDPVINIKDKKLFESDDEEGDKEGRFKKKSKEKPMYLKDVVATH